MQTSVSEKYAKETFSVNSAVVIVVKKMRLAAVATGLTNVASKVRTVTLIGKTGNRICNILCYKGAHFLPQLTFVAWILFDLLHFLSEFVL